MQTFALQLQTQTGRNAFVAALRDSAARVAVMSVAIAHPIKRSVFRCNSILGKVYGVKWNKKFSIRGEFPLVANG